MLRTFRFLAFTSLQLFAVESFSHVSISSISQRFGWTPRNKCLIPNQSSAKESLVCCFQAATATPSANTKVKVKTEIPVSRISVCAGELCQCQGEQFEYTGGASDAAVEELRSLGLPFPVDEVGCLGACGMGTMIAIDYDNGDSIMTDGLGSTFVELGIQTQEKAYSFSENEDATRENGSVVEAAADIHDKADLSSKTNMASANNANTILEQSKPPLMADVRDRMREEAAGEVENPWINMASYLVKKAAGNMFGPE
mmetsp:Transcript_43971/g.93615  ORF Transcript_43971/g.93615 Transcript_43971/m.93615 type:complete len:256 (+) Transcript_43971:143-910(+)